ncbi:MAG: YciI family protein [Microthrixaceae bacterium]
MHVDTVSACTTKGTIMQYMLLLYSADDAGPARGSAEQAAEMPLWMAYGEALGQAGAFVAGDALHPADSATTVRVRDGRTVSTDGPFAETKEVLGGFYLIDVEDLDAAIEWASKVPLAPYGSVEIRPVMVFD